MTMTLLSVYIPPILLHDKCLYKTGSKSTLELSISPFEFWAKIQNYHTTVMDNDYLTSLLVK